MHSDLLELALERGVPAVIFWLALLVLYARMLWRLNLKLKIASRSEDSSSSENDLRQFTLGPWIDRGIVLGALGGLAGFFASGLVHYNWGDSEVVMVLYWIMGLSLAVGRIQRLPR